MSNTNDFDLLKRKVYWAYHRDGIVDLAAATVLLGFSIFMATKNAAFLAVGVVFFAQYMLMKQRITIPRFGYVRFVPQEKAMRQSLLLLGLGVLFLLVIFVGNIFLRTSSIFPEMQAWTQQYHMVPLSAALFGLPALVVAVFLGLKRFFLYALLLVSLPALGAWLNVETFVPILATGLVVLAFGVTLLSSFLKKYPLHDEESSNVSG